MVFFWSKIVLFRVYPEEKYANDNQYGMIDPTIF
ncbi:hypothetical protein LVISKB_1425 [Levilactobacillus brevis KB290]|uniref:Uncharacterized protein n=1 Tax=Levilactobacillus brevis KB290 TaxID=1001583 RepID=M5AF84_LEVBR|nr:hypothetical protein LVISKB_1425 [Levilactobacillus brevis KB290]